MKGKGWVKDEPNKQKKRKRCFWLDDASRKILSGGEFENPNAENAISTFKRAEKKLDAYDCKIEQVNTDRASVFVANKNKGISEFQK